MSNILSEYLVALGLKDNLSPELNKTLNKTSSNITKFSQSFAKAGTFVGSLFITANVGIAKFIGNLVRADDEVNKFAHDIGKSKDEAFKIKSALAAMGKTMEEIAESEELTATFEKLQRDADKAKPPDFSEGLNQVREISVEFTRLKQTGTYTVQWIGHYLLKYLSQPLQKAKDIFSGLNDGIIKNIPKWGERAAWFMSGIVKLGAALIRGAGTVFNAVKKIFDMIPKEIKIAGAALAGLALFIRAGPLGTLITIISAALLLLEDFYTFLDGNDSLLGDFWGALIKVWDVFKDSDAIKSVMGIFEQLGNILSEILSPLKDIGKEGDISFSSIAKIGGIVLNSLIKTITKYLPKLAVFGRTIIEKILGGILKTIPLIMQIGVKIFNFLISTLTKMLPTLMQFAVTIINSIVTVIMQNLPDIINAGVQIIKAIINGIALILPQFVETAMTLISGIINAIIDNLDNILGAGTEILMSLIDGIMKILPQLIDAVINLVMNIIAAIMENLPAIISAGMEILISLINGIIKTLPQLINAIISLIEFILRAITENLPQIIDEGIKVVQSFISGLLSALPELVNVATTLIKNLVDIIGANLPDIIDAGIQILIALINGIVEVLPQLIDAAINIMMSLIDALIENLPKIIEAGIEIIVALVGGLIRAIPKIIEAIPQILSAILEGFGQLFPKVLELGGNLVKGLWDGITSMGSWIKDKVSGFVGDLFGGIGDFFGGLFGGDDKKDDKKKSGGGKRQGHAEGVISTQHHIAEISEGNQPEVIIPLNKPARAKTLLSQAASFVGINSSDDLSKKLDSLAQIMQNTYFMLSKMKTILGQGASVVNNNITNTVNNNQTYDMHTSFTINDTSGKPQATVSAVDRTMQIKIRNLKGILNT